MAIAITHTKVNQIADWTQADLDDQIAAGNFPPGTVLADIVLSSDWNDDHTSPDLDWLENNVRDVVIVDMGGGSYTMTDSEASAPFKWIINSGGGVLTFPTTSDSIVPKIQFFLTAFAGTPFSISSQSGGSTIDINNPFCDCIAYNGGSTPVSLFNNFVSSDVYSASWSSGILAPSQSAIYNSTSYFRRVSNGVTSNANASITINSAYEGFRLYCSNAGAVTVTVDNTASGGWTDNATLRIQAGPGGVTLSPGAGVTLIGSTTIAAYDCITIDKDGSTDTWYL